MHDREKIIKGLEETEIMLSQAVDRGGSMSVMGAFNCLNRVTDTLALLKEQEPVAPTKSYSMYCCGKCGCIVGIDDMKGAPGCKNRYCGDCGRKVKWDE